MYLQIKNDYSNLVAADSKLAKEEKKDCVVRAIAAVCNVSYVTAHRFCKEHFTRVDKQGTKNDKIEVAMNKFQEQGLEIDNRTFQVTRLEKELVKNRYKLYGEEIWREKTLKSFIETNPNGHFLVMVAKHALVVKDGEVIDWNSFTFKPTRKVQGAFRLEDNRIGTQTVLQF